MADNNDRIPFDVVGGTPISDPVFTGSVQGRATDENGGSSLGLPLDYSGSASQAFDAGMLFSVGEASDQIPRWSIYPGIRDRHLRKFAKEEPIFAGATYSIMTRIKALSYRFEGKESMQDDVQAMLDASDMGMGFRSLIGKTIIDLCTQDNGAFWELIGPGNPSGQLLQVQGVDYLDPARCYRSYDPEYPVIYINPITGKTHRMHRSRVVMMSSMTQPEELARGVGYSHLSRALLSVQTMRSIMKYRYEKVSGSFERAIGYGTGITRQTLQRMRQATDMMGEAEGFTRINRIPFFVGMRDIKMDILDLASIPDNFNLKDETEIYVYILALVFGVDAREFWAATQSGATRADASIQAMKARGRGLADLITTVEDAINRYLIPDSMKFVYDFLDDERDEAVARKNQTVVNYLKTAVDSGIITTEQAQSHAINENVFNEEMLANPVSYGIEDEDEEDIPINQGDTPIDADTFIPPNIAGGNEQGGGDVSEDSEDEEDEETKTFSNYRSSLRATARALYNGIFVRETFIVDYDRSITRGFNQAWLEGQKKEGIFKGEQTSEEIGKLQALIAEQSEFVPGLADFILGMKEEGQTIAVVMNRVDLWVNRYSMVVTAGQLSASGDRKKKWVIDPVKDHCIDCLRMNGRVYRASILEKYGVIPKSADLACFGSDCGCELVDTDEPLMRGRPPMMSRQKDYVYEMIGIKVDSWEDVWQALISEHAQQRQMGVEEPLLF